MAAESTPRQSFSASLATTAVVIVAATLALTAPAPAHAQCPPAGYPTSWPAAASWQAYTAIGTGIQDQQSGPDGSYGSSATPSAVDIYNGDSGNLPSLYWYFSSDILYFRQRLRGDPRQPNQTDNYKQYTWTVNFDLEGDGFSDFLVQVNGFSDTLQVLYDDDDNNLYDATSCPTGDITFERSVSGAVRLTDSSGSGEGYLLDWQVPLCTFSDCSGTQIITASTSFSMTFTTSTNAGNPTLKDAGRPGDYNTAQDKFLPGGDSCSLSGGCVQDPNITDRDATCDATPPSSVALRAFTLDTLDIDSTSETVVDTISTVLFEVRPIGGATWTTVTTVSSPDTDTVNTWSTTWTLSGETGEYRVRVTVTDDQSNTATDTFGFDLDTCVETSLPVSLAWVRSETSDRSTRVEWATATEAGNIGFNVYGHSGERWQRLNRRLVPSAAVDSLEPRSYELETAGHFDEILIEDVDLRGVATERGPYPVGKAVGRRPLVERIDWSAVRNGMNATAKSRPAESVDAVRLLVDRDGLYRVSYEQLSEAGFDLAGASPDHIALTAGGSPIPIFVGSTGLSISKEFGPGWYVEFVGAAVNNLYTKNSIYRLEVDRGLAQRMLADRQFGPPQNPPNPQSYRAADTFETNDQYSFSSPNGDPWYDERLLTYDSPTAFSFDIEVGDLAEVGDQPVLEVDLWGWTDFDAAPDHHVQLVFNGVEVADERFDGLIARTISVPLPAGLLVEGINTVGIELPGDTGVPYDLVALDRISIHYPRALVARDGSLRFEAGGRVFEVLGLGAGGATVYRLDGAQVTRLRAWRVPDGIRFHGAGTTTDYLVVGADAVMTPIIEPARPAVDITSGRTDYLVISHPAFIGGLDELVRARERDGLSVRVVDVDDVYEQFGHGLFGARAIADYIRFSAETMGVQWVLLVGGDSYDYHDNLGLGAVSFIPSPYRQTHPVVRFAPVDPAYGDVDGDGVPEVAVGRLPVRSIDQLRDIVSKTLGYSTLPYRRSAVLAADARDGALSFSEISDRLGDALGEDWNLSRAYVDESGIDGAHDTLVDTINSGVTLTAYFGHSGLTMWSFDSLLSADDAADLDNHGWPTTVVQWGCWNTYHVSPVVTTLGDAFMLSGEQGAAAVLGAAALTSVSSDRAYAELLLPVLTRPGVTIGEAMVAAKRELASQRPEAVDVLLGWTLLGDPALVIEP